MLARYLVGGLFTVFAVTLFILNQPVWSLLPAGAGVYILASTLWDALDT
jgi:hypothetical protein